MTDEQMRDAVDEIAIRSLHHAYADVVNRRAWQELRDLFVPDATVTVDMRTADPHVLEGPDALGAFIGGAVERFDFFELAVLSARVFLRVDGDADRAQARMYMNEIRHDAASGRWSMAYGLYQDRLVRVDAGWRFARRDYHSMARTAADLDVFPFPPDRLA
jgi:hypothetical protein